MNTNVYINGNCELVVAPECTTIDSVLEDIIDPCNTSEDTNTYVEFLISDGIDSESTLVVSSKRDFYIQSLPADGLYVYYCIKTFKESEITEGFRGLYYNSVKKTLFFNGSEVTDFSELVSLLPSLGSGNGVLSYEEIAVFSICRLRKCLVKMQKESISNCKKNKCNKANETEYMRDFLFISIYILEGLICEKRYAEAMDMLTSLTQCTSICDTANPKKSSCGCNG